MSDYLPSHWKPREELIRQLQNQGYTTDEIKRKHTEWKRKMITLKQKGDVGGLSNNWNTRWVIEMTQEEPEGAKKKGDKPKPKRYSQAADPEENARLKAKFDEIEKIDVSNASDRLKQIREILNDDKES